MRKNEPPCWVKQLIIQVSESTIILHSRLPRVSSSVNKSNGKSFTSDFTNLLLRKIFRTLEKHRVSMHSSCHRITRPVATSSSIKWPEDSIFGGRHIFKTFTVHYIILPRRRHCYWRDYYTQQQSLTDQEINQMCLRLPWKCYRQVAVNMLLD